MPFASAWMDLERCLSGKGQIQNDLSHMLGYKYGMGIMDAQKKQTKNWFSIRNSPQRRMGDGQRGTLW